MEVNIFFVVKSYLLSFLYFGYSVNKGILRSFEHGDLVMHGLLDCFLQVFLRSY